MIAHPELPFLALVLLAGSFALAETVLEIGRIFYRWFHECLNGTTTNDVTR